MKKQQEQASAPEGVIINHGAVNRLGNDDQLSLRKIFGIIKQFKWTLLATMAVITGMTWFFLGQVDDRYDSEALILFEETVAQALPSSEQTSKVPLDEVYLSSQIAVLQSRELGLRVMSMLGLESSEEFLVEDSLFPFLNDSSAVDEQTRYSVRVDGDERQIPARAYEYFRKNLKVALLPKTRVISLSFRSKDPELAAKVVNTLAEIYISDGLEKKKESSRQANRILRDELEELKGKAEFSARAVVEFKSTHGLDETVGKGLLAQQISELNTQLVVVRAERVEAQARYAQVQRLSRNGNGVSAIAVLDSPLVQKLRDEELQARKKIKELSQEYGVLHPRMVSARSQLKSVQLSLKQEVARIVAGVRDQLEIVRVREQSLTNSLEALKKQVEKAEAFGVELEALEREASSNQTLLESYLAKVKSSQALNAEFFIRSEASLITRGYAALEPSSPKRSALLILAVVGSFLLGLVLVFMKDSLARDRDDSEASRLSGDRSKAVNLNVVETEAAQNQSVLEFPDKSRAAQPVAQKAMVTPFVTPLAVVNGQDAPEWETSGVVSVVGALPQIRSAMPVAQMVTMFDESIAPAGFRAAVNRLSESLLGGGADKSVLVTSSERTVAKAFVAVACAKELAAAGKQAIVIDLDFSSPSLHLVLNDENHRGMIDYLDGKATLGSLVQSRDGIDVLYAGQREVAPSGFFNHDVLVSVVELLSEDYNKVILLAGPFIVSPDVQKFSADMDRTVYVLPEKIRRNKKVLAEIVRFSKEKEKDAGVLYIG